MALLAAFVAVAVYACAAIFGSQLLYASVQDAVDPVLPQIQSLLLMIGLTISVLIFVPVGLLVRSDVGKMWTAYLWPTGSIALPFVAAHIFAWPIALIAWIWGGIWLLRRHGTMDAPS